MTTFNASKTQFYNTNIAFHFKKISISDTENNCLQNKLWNSEYSNVIQIIFIIILTLKSSGGNNNYQVLTTLRYSANDFNILS